ncbi:MAG: branched-chain amino acid ABC transporter permease, partial [SAR324 cluster bacterium]|nr:branched-chain amino acid ABC transporter permease [SAR324 cluster bacterium]
MDLLFSGQILFAALVLGSVYSLVALGLNLVYGTMRLLNIAHGDIIMIGAYIAFWLFTLGGVSPLLSLLVAVVLSAGLGAVIFYGLFARQLGSSLMIERIEANSLLIFFGVSVIIQNTSSLAFTASPRAYQYMDNVYHFAGVSMSVNRLLTLFVTLIICFLVIIFLRTNIYGLAIKALIQNPTAAAIVGIKVKRVQLVSFCVGFGLTGLTGALLS